MTFDNFLFVILLQTYTGSPFRSTITDKPVTDSPAANVSCHGTGLQPNTVHPGQPTTFTVDASKAPLSATPEVVVTELTSGRTAIKYSACLM